MSQDVTLEVGQVTETLEVRANAVSVQTTDTQINQSVTLSDIATLPQLGRTPITLAIFQPAVQINPQADGSSSGADYSFALVRRHRAGDHALVNGLVFQKDLGRFDPGFIDLSAANLLVAVAQVQPDETDQLLRIAGCRRVSKIWN
jgi:hypothetical protein